MILTKDLLQVLIVIREIDNILPNGIRTALDI